MNGADQPLVIGTRGSALARAQTEMVEQALRAAWPDLVIEIKIIKTSGDETARSSAEPVDRRAGRKGMFTAEIERALLAEEIDLAVHSAKDFPSEETPGLEICSVLPRGPVEDVLIMKAPGDFVSLRAGAIVATGSVRRAYQLKAKRADLRIADVRGNVPTRLRKLVESDWDALVLARAGLERLGFEPARQIIQFEGIKLSTELLSDLVPAGGQGIIALQARSEDEKTKQFIERVNHAETFLCLQAEREFLRLLHGDCDSPVGVLATITASAMKLRAEVFEPESRVYRSGEVNGNPEQHESLAAELIRQINGG
ncbi:MAG: hydroxymethylbilane synthase [Verrucomicrobiota bacterium]